MDRFRLIMTRFAEVDAPFAALLICLASTFAVSIWSLFK